MRGQRTGARHRKTRPRYRRIAAASSAATITVVSLLGAAGLLPTDGGSGRAFAATASSDRPAPPQPHGSGTPSVTPSRSSTAVGETASAEIGTPAEADATAETGERAEVDASADPPVMLREADRPDATATDVAVPARSGHGKRVVFDMSEQRVWLVAAGNDVERTYLVSGSVTDNLGPGVYEVYSKSVDAVGIDDSGTMKYMVRFAHGENAAIGFHDIPVHDGRRVQTRAELGSPRSHGCIRQWRPDARALWDFAPLGTTVVVVR